MCKISQILLHAHQVKEQCRDICVLPVVYTFIPNDGVTETMNRCFVKPVVRQDIINIKLKLAIVMTAKKWKQTRTKYNLSRAVKRENDRAHRGSGQRQAI